jgi:hypothetical protein
VVVNQTLCSAEAESNSSATKWTSPLAMNNRCSSPCKNRLTLNPHNCNCGVPLIVTLEFRALTSSNIDDEALWASLENQTYVSLSNLTSHNKPPLKLDRSQVWAILNIFPLADNIIMDQPTEDLIKTSFTYQKISYSSPFKPELVVGIEPSRGTQ